MRIRSFRRRFGLVGLALVGGITLPMACECSGNGSKPDGVAGAGAPPLTTVPTTAKSGKYVITDLSFSMGGGDDPKDAPVPPPAPPAQGGQPAAGQR